MSNMLESLRQLACRELGVAEGDLTAMPPSPTSAWIR